MRAQNVKKGKYEISILHAIKAKSNLCEAVNVIVLALLPDGRELEIAEMPFIEINTFNAMPRDVIVKQSLIKADLTDI